MTLQDLALNYRTDKLEHGYIPFYEKHLPHNPRKILEIGVKDGASIQMWHEYYPNAEVHGLDLFSEKSAREVWDQIGSDKITLHTGNQIDWRILEQLRNYDFDVIIDDGSHNSRDQMMTFFGLFNGKHYFIEDLHCCREEFYSQGLPYLLSADSLLTPQRMHGRLYNNSSINAIHNGSISLIYAS